jgi:hypothetical protein
MLGLLTEAQDVETWCVFRGTKDGFQGGGGDAMCFGMIRSLNESNGNMNDL